MPASWRKSPAPSRWSPISSPNGSAATPTTSKSAPSPARSWASPSPPCSAGPRTPPPTTSPCSTPASPTSKPACRCRAHGSPRPRERQHRQQLIDHMRRRDSGDLSVIVGRTNLDQVDSDDAGAGGEAAEDGEEFAAGEPAGFGGAGAGGVGRVEDVDVDRDVQRRVADVGADALGDGVGAVAADGHRVDHLEAEVGVFLEVGGRVQGTAGADVDGAVLAQQAFLAGAAKRGAMGVRGAEVSVPGVEVGVEVEQRDRSPELVGGAQQRQRDGVVAADGDEAAAVGEQALGGALDLADGLLDVEGIAGDVAGIGDLLGAEWLDVEAGMVRAQQPGAGTDVRRAEACPGPVSDTAVERHADDGDLAALDLVVAGEPRERGRPGEAGNGPRVDRSARRLARRVVQLPVPGILVVEVAGIGPVAVLVQRLPPSVRICGCLVPLRLWRTGRCGSGWRSRPRRGWIPSTRRSGARHTTASPPPRSAPAGFIPPTSRAASRWRKWTRCSSGWRTGCSPAA